MSKTKAAVVAEVEVVDKDNMRASEAIGINMSHSRVKTRLNRYCVNKVFDDQLEVLKEEMVKAKGKKKEELEKKCQALSRGKVRISDGSPIVLSCILDQMVSQLAVAGFNHALNDCKLKTLKVKHLVDSGVCENVQLRSLFENLDTYKHPERYMKAEPVAEAEAVPEGEAEAEPKVAEPEAVAEAEDDNSHDRSKFNSYIEKIIKHVKNSCEEFKNMRVAGEVTKFCNDLVTDCVRRYHVLVHFLLEAKKSKTIDPDTIMTATKLMLLDGHSPTEELEYVTEKHKVKGEDGVVKQEDVLVAKTSVNFETNAFSDLEEFVTGKVAEWQAWKDHKEETKQAEATPAEAAVVKTEKAKK